MSGRHQLRPEEPEKKIYENRRALSVILTSENKMACKISVFSNAVFTTFGICQIAALSMARSANDPI